MHFFSTETKVYQWLEKYCTIMLVGLVWLITLVPFVTVGASCSAMSRQMINLREGKGAGVVPFFKTFVKDFGKATLLWLTALIVPAAVLALYLFTSVSGSEAVFIIFIVVILWMFAFVYVFPLNAFFENTVVGTFKNAILMSLQFIKKTVPMVAITMLPVFVYMVIGKTYFIYSVPVWVFILFPLMEYWKSCFYLKVFYEYIPESERIAFADNKTEE